MTANLASINANNREFWAREKALTSLRIEDVANIEVALALMRTEGGYLPFGMRRRFEVLLAEAELYRQMVLGRPPISPSAEMLDSISRDVRASFAKKGGRAPKSDALTILIVEIVEANPTITEEELLRALAARRGEGVILDIDNREISFTHRGGVKDTKISGMKDRLSRAKKVVLLHRPSKRVHLADRLARE